MSHYSDSYRKATYANGQSDYSTLSRDRYAGRLVHTATGHIVDWASGSRKQCEAELNERLARVCVTQSLRDRVARKPLPKPEEFHIEFAKFVPISSDEYWAMRGIRRARVNNVNEKA